MIGIRLGEMKGRRRENHTATVLIDIPGAMVRLLNTNHTQG